MTIPREWVGECRLEIRLPKRVRCDGCDGGGCSRCENRGGFDLFGDAQRVALHARIPAEGAKVRVMKPLGDDGPIDIIVFRVAVGDAPSPSITRQVSRHAPLVSASPSPPTSLKWAVGLVVAVVILVLSLALR